MNPNLFPDDTCHDIEIMVQLLLKIQIQTYPDRPETSDESDRMSHRVKHISIVNVEPVSQHVSVRDR